MMNNNKDVYIWCCDFNHYRGEGILARSFVKYLSKNKKKIFIKTFNKNYLFYKNKYRKNSNFKNKEKINLNLFENYIYPILGIIWLWKKYIEKKDIIYLNFNPLWNIFVFIFSPPGTSFGPITGSIFNSEAKNISQLIRKYIFPIFYQIGLFFLFLRKKKILFSTSLLKKIISKKNLNKCIFDFQLNYYNQISKNKFKKNKKNIDLIYYNRDHSNKKNKIFIKILKEISNKFNVVVIGDFLNIKNVKNLRLLSKKRTNKIILQSKFTFAAPENVISMFTLECLASNMKIFYDKKQKTINKFFYTKNLIPIDFNNYNNAINIVQKNLIKRYTSNKIVFNNKFWKKRIKDFDSYFLTC